MISIIIPTFNEEKVIAESLERLREHLTDIPYELIVTDDDSTDQTIARASQGADQVVICPKGKHTTIAANRNRGAATARFPYIVFIDGDAIVPNPNHFFKKALASFTKNPKLLGLAVNIEVSPDKASVADKIVFGTMNIWFRFANNLLHLGIAQGKFQMIRTDAFIKIGGYNEKLAAAEDAELFHRLSRIGDTRLESSLTIFHSGRRAHRLGWPKLLTLWFLDTLFLILFKRSYSKEWKAVR